MAGIYIHIPFCKQACHYCDFHFSTSVKNKNAFLAALKNEIRFRKNYFSIPTARGNEGSSNFPLSPIQTIYFGGGTPSLLTSEELLGIFEVLNACFTIEKNAEITLEANPDDLTPEKLSELKKTPVNRLSIGIQSFEDIDLGLLNRSHNSFQAIQSVKHAIDLGFDNITLDLIYGIPTLTNESWKSNLEKAFSLNVPHISAYCLTAEPKTAMADFIKKGKLIPGKGSNPAIKWMLDDDKSASQFEILLNEMEANNFVQYEISNFCKTDLLQGGTSGFINEKGYPGRVGIHNSNYWKGNNYIGFGPSAHSFNGDSRQWNVSNNPLYIKSYEKNQMNFELEILTEENKYNEYILTSLRTIWGCSLETVKNNFGETLLIYLLKNAQPYLSQNFLTRDQSILTLTKKGKFISDKIISDLFVLQ